jgi:hypothetical protein
MLPNVTYDFYVHTAGRGVSYDTFKPRTAGQAERPIPKGYFGLSVESSAFATMSIIGQASRLRIACIAAPRTARPPKARSDGLSREP